MIWIKRLIFVFVLAAIIAAWPIYNRIRQSRLEKQAEIYSLITAEAWVASAQLRYDPELFLIYRDSILILRGHTREELAQFLTDYSDDAEVYARFVELVSKYVDSLVANRGITTPAKMDEDSVIGYRRLKATDSVK